jgi:hypothetical protein|tara:strand:+ start:123 stop:296 length:174 start_codon:yes stop_codon:yes gene_type:complete
MPRNMAYTTIGVAVGYLIFIFIVGPYIKGMVMKLGTGKKRKAKKKYVVEAVETKKYS